MSKFVLTGASGRERTIAPYQVFNVTEVPAAGTGNNGDYAILYGNDNKMIYKKVAGSWVPISESYSVKNKSGQVLKAAFSGNPKKATVTFGTAYADTNYAVTLGNVITANVNSSYLASVESKGTTGFTINLLTNNIDNLVSVDWATVPFNNP